MYNPPMPSVRPSKILVDQPKGKMKSFTILRAIGAIVRLYNSIYRESKEPHY